MRDLTIRHAQKHQPWTVPYSAGIDIASQKLVPHILASHVVLHATKTVGKLASVFEALDHSRNIGIEGRSEEMSPAQLDVVKAMSADLLTVALRLANLHKFDLETVLLERIREKNGVELEPMVPYQGSDFS